MSGSIKRLLALVALAGVSAGQQPTPELLGRWRSAEVSTTGLGTILHFQPGGTVDYSPGAVVEMTYRIEGKEIIFPPDTIKGPEMRQPLEFNGQNQLRLAKVTLQRQGPAPDAGNPILGEWRGKLEAKDGPPEAFYFFYPGGKCLLLLPFQTTPGRYKINGSSMRLEIPGQPPAEGAFQVTADSLTIPGAGKTRLRLRRY